MQTGSKNIEIAVMGGDCKLQVLDPKEVDLVAAQIEKENAEEVGFALGFILFSTYFDSSNALTKQAENKMKRGVNKTGEE